eukprot:3452082-Prymnesium_polylepis.1
MLPSERTASPALRWCDARARSSRRLLLALNIERISTSASARSECARLPGGIASGCLYRPAALLSNASTTFSFSRLYWRR